MKKTAFLTAAALTASMIFSSAAVHAADDISIVVNGNKIKTETPAVIVDDRTLVPLRAISESLGWDVAWDPATQGITITNGGSLFFTWIGRDHIFVTSAMALEDYAVAEVPPRIIDDFTMVPLRVISEALGAQVNWNGSSRTVSVDIDSAIPVQDGLAEKYIVFEQALAKKYDAYKNFVDRTGEIINAEIELENGGVIELELYPEIAPVTVANFVKLANEGFYDGLIFHRVIEGFMIQGGGFDTSYNHKDAESIVGEFIENGYFNLIPHEDGMISMARTNDMNSASSQFFIMHEHAHSLDGKYAAFGMVTKGFEFVNEIATTPTEYNDTLGAEDVPVEQQVIKSIRIK